MKQLFFVLFLFVTSHSFAQHKGPDGLEWYTDLMKAQEKSKASHKPIFAFFTGSDWCGWCHKLQNDVFSKPSFIKWAKEKVVLLELDFPRQKKLPDETIQQNNSLQQAFQVRGYPTCWLFFMEQDKATQKMNINALGSLGYPAGAEVGKEDMKFLNEANTILNKKPDPAPAPAAH